MRSQISAGTVPARADECLRIPSPSGGPGNPFRNRCAIFLVLPLALLLPTYRPISVWVFKLREPSYAFPLRGVDSIRIRKDPYGSGEFGAPRNGGRTHRGVDLVAPVGTPVAAAKSGVAFIGRFRNGMGRYVEVHHPDGAMTRYAHLKKIFIRDRQRVHRGDALGAVGKSGNARRRLIQPHLHFEVWNEEGVPVDPLAVMDVARSEKVIASDREAPKGPWRERSNLP